MDDRAGMLISQRRTNWRLWGYTAFGRRVVNGGGTRRWVRDAGRLLTVTVLHGECSANWRVVELAR